MSSNPYRYLLRALVGRGLSWLAPAARWLAVLVSLSVWPDLPDAEPGSVPSAETSSRYRDHAITSRYRCDFNRGIGAGSSRRGSGGSAGAGGRQGALRARARRSHP